MKIAANPRTLGLLLALLLCACGPRQTELVRTVDWSVEDVPSWKGRGAEDLVATLGRPGSIEPDGEGGQIWVYEKITMREYEDDDIGVPRPVGERPDGAIGYGPMKKFPEKTAMASFRLDEQGVIYRQWINPKLGKKTRRALAPPKE